MSQPHKIQGELMGAILLNIMHHPDTNPALLQEMSNPKPDVEKLFKLLVQHNTEGHAKLLGGRGQSQSQPSQSEQPLSFDSVASSLGQFIKKRR